MSPSSYERARLLGKVRRREPLTKSETAAFVGITPSAVAVTEARALEKLRRAIGLEKNFQDSGK